jgi:hypothetical protein
MEIPSFILPANGQVTPEMVARRRKLAETLMGQGIDTSPVESPWQAVGRIGEAAIGGYSDYKAGQQEQEGRKSAQGAMADLLQSDKSPSNASIMGAMNNPWITDSQSRLAEMLMKDNLKQAHPGAGSKFGLNGVWAKGKDGKMHMYQLNEGGGAMQEAPLPEGMDLMPPVTVQDFGTYKQPITTRGGVPMGEPMPIDIAGKYNQENMGKGQGTAAATAPAAAITAQQTVQKIDELMGDPDLSGVSGWQSYLPDAGVAAVSGPHALALRRRVEQLRGTAFLEAYNGLRGGGQITEVEGKKAEDALARLDTAQSDADYMQALRDFRDAVVVGYQKLAATAGGNAPDLTVPPPPQAGGQSGAPTPGTVEDGHVFLGGNPADPNSWKPVQ